MKKQALKGRPSREEQIKEIRQIAQDLAMISKGHAAGPPSISPCRGPFSSYDEYKDTKHVPNESYGDREWDEILHAMEQWDGIRKG